MSFGTKIKELRRQKNITQEKLAEYLNISPQAISRWETDNAFPDISLLAPICNIFDITSDELLDINVKNKEAELKKYNDSFIKWASDISKTEEIRQNTIITLRQGVRLYPDQLLLKKQLVTVLYVNSENEPNLDEKIEMCNLCKELVESDIPKDEKYQYIAMYCQNARFIGCGKEGESMVELLPESQYFKKRCSALCAENDEIRKNRILEYIQDGWEILRDGIGLLTTECKNTLTELLSIREKLEKINEILYDHDDIALYEDLDEFKAAQAFYQIGDYDLTIQYLSICLHKWTRLEENKKVSSWRGKEPLKEKSSKDIEVQASSFIKLVNSRFASILSDDRVVKMLSEASKIAN